MNWYQSQRMKRERERRNRELGTPEPPPEPPLTAIYSKSSPRRVKGQWTNRQRERGTELS